MRILIRATCATVLSALALQATPAVASEICTQPPPGGAEFVFNLQLDGTYWDDKGAKRRSCDEGYSFVSANSPPSIELPASPAAWRRTIDGVEQVLFWTFCLRYESLADQVGAPLVMNPRTTWVGIPTPGAIIPTLFAQIQGLIAPPIVSWPTIDPEFGWLYVNADMEFRVAALTPVTATGTLTNILGSVTASQTATPVAVPFHSGEPGGGMRTCSVEDATAPFAIKVIGACSYRYRNSSAVSANGRTFDTRIVVTWELSGDLEPGAPTTLETFVEAPVAVAEVQALVCATSSC